MNEKHSINTQQFVVAAASGKHISLTHASQFRQTTKY
jgi:hypothetical protein